MDHPYLPVLLDLVDASCLVVGAGEVALRKVESLLDARALVTVIAPSAVPGIERLARESRITWQARGYQSPEAREYRFVIGAADDPTVNRRVFDDAYKKQIPVNVVDDPQHCTVIFPAVVRREDLTIAISTGGRAPFLAAGIRAELEQQFGVDWSLVLQFAERYRDEVRSRKYDGKSAQDAFRAFMNVNWPEILRQSGSAAAEQRLTQLVSTLQSHSGS